MLRFLLVGLIIVICAPLNSTAQTVIDEHEDYKSILYRNEYSFGAILHSSGWGINFNRGKHITGYKKRMFEFDYVGMKHPKEVKSVYYENAKSYVYGKQNTFNILRASIGEQRMLYSKSTRQGIEVRLNYALGASIGFAKPVYLEIIKDTDQIPPNDTLDFIEIEKYNSDEHFIDNIYGRASFTNGLDEVKVHPGLHTKLAVSFGYGYLDDDVKALETGMTLDVYPKEVPIMALIDNKQLFFNFYIKLIYGRKW